MNAKEQLAAETAGCSLAPSGGRRGSHWPVAMEREPRIFGLRGAAWAFPPNTLLAFEAALGEGAHGLACDVEVTADGHPVVCEDRLLRAVAPGPRRVCDVSLHRLQQIDVGASWSPPHRGVRVPTLREMIATFGGRVPLILLLPGSEGGPIAAQRVWATVSATLSDLPDTNVEIAILTDQESVLAAAGEAVRPVRRILRVRQRPVDESTLPSWLDGICMSVRSRAVTRASLPATLELIGTECDTPAGAKRAAAGPYSTLLSERPGWLIERRRGAAEEQRLMGT